MTEKYIAFTGGGTGGHIYPGLAIIEKLKVMAAADADIKIIWIGSNKPAERDAVESAGIDFFPIPSGKLRRSFSLKNFTDVFKVLAAYFSARKLLKKYKPCLLFSKGGYVSVPPCYAAASLGIPVFTHESDLSPGLATRLNSKKAEKILLSWEHGRKLLPKAMENKIVISGNPVRSAIKKGDPAKGRAWLGFDDSLPIILVLGGSQGAKQINELTAAILPDLAGRARIAHQYGADNNAITASNVSYCGFAFSKDGMADLYAAADIIVGRAGAGTLWEGAACAKPMIFIPLSGTGTRGDQVENAEYMERAGAAISLAGAKASKEQLLDSIQALLESPITRKNMGEKAASLAGSDAASTIAELILERLKKVG